MDTQKAKAARTSPTVLIVDDDETLRYTLGRLTKGAGFEIQEATTATEALASAGQDLPDVIVADVRLPDFDGFELCRRLKAEKTTSKIPVLLVSSMYYGLDRSPEDLKAGRARAKILGALDLMPRGETMDQLVPALKKLFPQKASKRSR